MARKPIIAGNWKLNKLTGEARELIDGIMTEVKELSTEQLPVVVVAPVFTALQTAYETITKCGCGKVKLSAQNCYWENSGAFTGEVSLPMIKELGCEYVIIGHSERRQYFCETDEMINKKAKAILAAGLVPIICCGESLEQREAGITDSHIATQIKEALKEISANDVANSVIAYEPIWAIGTGKTCDSVEANRVIKMIREVVAEVAGKDSADKIRILYGGSVKPSTIEEQMSQSDIDGALVGGASLTVADFSGIIKGCAKVKA